VRRSEKHELKSERAHTHRYNLYYVTWYLYRAKRVRVPECQKFAICGL